ncbi:MAG TPA: hypothetical protein VKV26_12410 [Dehalococcoidia bacterium]|nr:hypothetical protein [Dehalococcoidia bacterium]
MPIIPFRSCRPAAPGLSLCALGLICLLLWSGQRQLPRAAAQAEAASVTYHAGWNLVAVPTGTELRGAAGPAYALGPGDAGYVPLGQGELVGGRAAWVYFPQDATITLGRSAAEYSRVLAPAGSYLLAGNPSASEALPIAGADMAMAYDPVNGYQQVSELQPGQGAFVVSQAGGAIALGKAPSGDLADQVQQLQRSLTDHPTDRANIDQLGAVAAELVRARQYDQVQSSMDDLRAAAEDGLRQAGSGLLPPLSAVQIGSEVQVREALARARDAAATGNLGQADAEVAAAQRAAQAAEDDGVSLAQNGPGMSYLVARPRQSATQNLAGFGALLRSSFFASSLGQPPQDSFWNLANTVLASPPISVPPPASVAPSGPAAASATPAPTATPAGGDCAQSCAFTGDGTYTISTEQNFYEVSGTVSVRINVSGGQVSGQGTYQGQGTYHIPDLQCAPVPYSGSLNVTGSFANGTLHLTFTASGVQQVNVTCQNVPISVSTEGAGFPPTAFFNPIDVAARDGASGTANASGQVPGLSGTISITLHKAQ